MKNKRFSQDNKFKVPLTQNVSQINCVKVILIYKSWYKPIGWLVFASSQVTRIRRGYMKNLTKHLISKTKTNIKFWTSLKMKAGCLSKLFYWYPGPSIKPCISRDVITTCLCKFILVFLFLSQ